MKVENVIFDFDGTIVDSYPGIVSAFNIAYRQVYGTENKIDLKPFIGPPIYQILSSIKGESDPQRIEQYVSCFKQQYDTNDYRLTLLYDGMLTVLEQLQTSGIRSYIATNKREKSTKLILEHLNLNSYFDGIYCSDLADKNYASKVEMINDLLTVENVDPKTTVLVGDTKHDQIAAESNGIEFIYASFGFGDLKNINHTISKPVELIKLLDSE
jgi:phosphoglycolate phosphatase